MAEQNLNIISVFTKKLPYKLANQMYHEFESRYKEAIYLIFQFDYYKTLRKNLRSMEIILTVSIFHNLIVLPW